MKELDQHFAKVPRLRPVIRLCKNEINEMDQRTLAEVLAEMSVVDADLRYYAITMTVDVDGNEHVDTQTQWGGWANEERRTELRVPSLVNPKALARAWMIMQQPYLVVNNEPAWFAYFCLGGNALVEERIAEEFLAGTFHVMRTEGATAKTGGGGFIAVSTLPKHAIQRAPTPKLRMEVFNRDNRRCRICGCSPANNEHVELHIHHIRPWERGGLTYLQNLITLCHTCHKGLDPHEDHSLSGLIPSSKSGDDTHREDVLRYRERIWNTIAEYASALNPRKPRSPNPRWKRRRRIAT